jgi:hypothetical protein
MIVADTGSDDFMVGNDLLEPACGGHVRGKPGFWQMIKGETQKQSGARRKYQIQRA